MTTVEALRGARKLVESGLVGPYPGAPPYMGTSATERARYSVEFALDAVAPEQTSAAWADLERIVAPVWAELSDFNERHCEDLADPKRPLTAATRPVWLQALALARLPHGPTAHEWFEDPKRTLSDVLRAFDKAINRAKTGRTT